MLRYGQDYIDVGDVAYELKFQARRIASLKEAAKSLGYSLTQTPDSSRTPG